MQPRVPTTVPEPLMTDDQLLNAFEATTLPESAWTHEAHVRIAYLYSSTLDFATALSEVRRRIKAFNAATNTPEAIDRGYHETITTAFMRLVANAIAQAEPYNNSLDFCASHPELMHKRVLLDYYTRDRIMSWKAKRSFIEPDLKPLP